MSLSFIEVASGRHSTGAARGTDADSAGKRWAGASGRRGLRGLLGFPVSQPLMWAWPGQAGAGGGWPTGACGWRPASSRWRSERGPGRASHPGCHPGRAGWHGDCPARRWPACTGQTSQRRGAGCGRRSSWGGWAAAGTLSHQWGGARVRGPVSPITAGSEPQDFSEPEALKAHSVQPPRQVWGPRPPAKGGEDRPFSKQTSTRHSIPPCSFPREAQPGLLLQEGLQTCALESPLCPCP